MFEPFHDTPSLREALGCIRKALVVDHAEHLGGERTEGVEAEVRFTLWILSGGHPGTVLTSLGFVPLPGWPVGVYTAPPGFRTRLVVTSALPAIRGTLLLRLMGSKTTTAKAIAELARLPPDAPERIIAEPLLIELRLTTSLSPTLRSEEEELLMTTLELYETWKQRFLDEGRQEGRQEGREEGREEGLRMAIARALQLRFGAVSSQLSAALEAEHEFAALTRYFDLATTGSIDEVERTLLTPRD